MVENTKRALEKGFTAMKLKVGSADPERDIRRAELIRKTAGDAATIMVDANQQWTVHKALYVIDKLRSINPYWVEEPTDPDDVLATILCGGRSIPSASPWASMFPIKSFSRTICRPTPWISTRWMPSGSAVFRNSFSSA